MIRVLIVDDHPALRSGLHAVLDAHPAFVPLGMAADETELWPRYNATRPDLVLMDYHLPGADGLLLCRQLKALIPAPVVVIYSAYADSELVVQAILAGADGLVNKSMPASELYAVLTHAMEGERVLPPLLPDAVDRALARLPSADEPALKMVLAGTSPHETARRLGTPLAAINEAITFALRRLRLDVPTPYAAGGA